MSATIEQRLDKLEAMIEEIHRLLTGQGAPINGVDEVAWRAVVKDLWQGDTKSLEIYMRRGGQIPDRGKGA
jgi:hypothetical protein